MRMAAWGSWTTGIPVSVNKQTLSFCTSPRPAVPQNNCNPAPDLVLWKLIFQCVLFARVVFCSQTPGYDLDRSLERTRRGREGVDPTWPCVDLGSPEAPGVIL